MKSLLNAVLKLISRIPPSFPILVKVLVWMVVKNKLSYQIFFYYYKGCMLRLCTLMNNWVLLMCQPVCECFNGAALLQNNCNSSVALLSISIVHRALHLD